MKKNTNKKENNLFTLYTCNVLINGPDVWENFKGEATFKKDGLKLLKGKNKKETEKAIKAHGNKLPISIYSIRGSVREILEKQLIQTLFVLAKGYVDFGISGKDWENKLKELQEKYKLVEN